VDEKNSSLEKGLTDDQAIKDATTRGDRRPQASGKNRREPCIRKFDGGVIQSPKEGESEYGDKTRQVNMILGHLPFLFSASIPCPQPAKKFQTLTPSKGKTSQEKYQTRACLVNPFDCSLFENDLPFENDLRDNPLSSEAVDVILCIA
jgi:hypothetical protein